MFTAPRRMIRSDLAPKALVQCLPMAWELETSDPKMCNDWVLTNPAWGQSLVTCLVLWQMRGGDIVVGDIDGLPYQHFQVVKEDQLIDLTWQQFETGTKMEHVHPKSPAHQRRVHRAIEEDETLQHRLSLLIENLARAGSEVGAAGNQIIEGFKASNAGIFAKKLNLQTPRPSLKKKNLNMDAPKPR